VEPTLSEVHADLVARLEQDKRLRTVEQQQAATNAEVGNLRTDIARLEGANAAGFTEVKALIQENRPRPAWPAISAMVAAIALLLVIAERLYS
jgi:hypothetical protein